MNRYSKTIASRALSAGLLAFTLGGCDSGSDVVPTEVYKRLVTEKSQLESTASHSQKQLVEAQQAIARQQQEATELEGRLQQVQKANQEQVAKCEQTERHLKDAERTLARQETLVAHAEGGLSVWKTGAALLLVLAAVMLFAGAAAGSATRKEVAK